MFEVGSLSCIVIGISGVVVVALGFVLSQWILTWWTMVEYSLNIVQDHREVCRNCGNWCFHLGTFDRGLHEIVCPCPVTLEKMRALDVCNEYSHWSERGW